MCKKLIALVIGDRSKKSNDDRMIAVIVKISLSQKSPAKENQPRASLLFPLD